LEPQSDIFGVAVRFWVRFGGVFACLLGCFREKTPTNPHMNAIGLSGGYDLDAVWAIFDGKLAIFCRCVTGQRQLLRRGSRVRVTWFEMVKRSNIRAKANMADSLDSTQVRNDGAQDTKVLACVIVPQRDYYPNSSTSALHMSSSYMS
jgi:hypothetical protein